MLAILSLSMMNNIVLSKLNYLDRLSYVLLSFLPVINFSTGYLDPISSDAPYPKEFRNLFGALRRSLFDFFFFLNIHKLMKNIYIKFEMFMMVFLSRNIPFYLHPVTNCIKLFILTQYLYTFGSILL